MAVDESPELKAIMPQIEARYQAKIEKLVGILQKLNYNRSIEQIRMFTKKAA